MPSAGKGKREKRGGRWGAAARKAPEEEEEGQIGKGSVFSPGAVKLLVLQEESWPRCHAGLLLLSPSACLPPPSLSPSSFSSSSITSPRVTRTVQPGGAGGSALPGPALRCPPPPGCYRAPRPGAEPGQPRCPSRSPGRADRAAGHLAGRRR